MTKTQRRRNKAALIARRLYTVVGNAYPCDDGCQRIGNIQHHYPAGTVLERDDETYDHSDNSYVYAAVKERDRVLYADSQWLNTVQVI